MMVLGSVHQGGNTSIIATIVIEAIMLKMKVTITAKVKIALPVTIKIKPGQTLPPGPNLPCIVPIATVCFLGKIVFKRIKPKERKEETTVFVRDGRNAHSAEQNIKPIPKNHTNATM